ncbi:MAG: hypothetical protein QM770_08465 [Tepidisphaeraceae bacterium]
MIQFPCHRCSWKISVHDDQAGESVQCPSCGFLVDVPRLDELGNLTDDGTYELNDATPRTAPTLADNRKLPSLLEQHGEDRRTSLEDFMKIGVSSDEQLELNQEVRPGVPKAPKYDPITGELLLPIEVAQEKVPAGKAIAVAHPAGTPGASGSKTLQYAAVSKHAGGVSSVFYPFVGMLKTGNFVVWLIVTLVLAANVAMVTVPILGLLYMFIIGPFVTVFLVAHIANVIDETGPADHDELPTLLRHASWSEDLWRPLVQVAFSFMYASAPLFAAGIWMGGTLPPQIYWPLVIVLAFVFPAALMTAVCSGTVNNMLPHRCLGVIPVIGVKYFLPVIAMGAGLITLVAGLAMMVTGMTGLNATMLSPVKTAIPIGFLSVASLPVLGGAVYLLHVACWQLGLLYRRHQSEFPWVLQHFVKGSRDDLLSQLERRRG